ncbi:MAG TPA: PIN domain-containing protein [Candidatus Brocadiia bacterium]|nr:PIN domain-containing protein [Candidatus Brocadiia bacterium]
MRILVDTNVVLDLFLAREPFFAGAARLFAMIERGEVEAYLCAASVTTVDYLLRRSLGASEAKKALRLLMRLFGVAPVNRAVLEAALDSRVRDFEDAVIAESARLVDAAQIVTRNTRDFRGSPVAALEPSRFLAKQQD